MLARSQQAVVDSIPFRHDAAKVPDPLSQGHQSFRGGVALVSPSGWGNFGDAAIVDSVIHAVRTRLQAAPLLGLTLNPEDTERRHGIPAFTCTGFARPYYGVNRGRVSGGADEESAAAPSGESTSGWRRVLGRGKQAVHRTPGLREIWTAARSLRDDYRHRTELASHVAELSYIVVAGGGQLDDFWGGAFGHPYVLNRWARHAGKTGAKFVVLSVGTGSLKTSLARRFVHGALARAEYYSFRDQGSRQLIHDARFADGPVVPDLAYGLPVDEFRVSVDSSRERPLVGFSPIAYCDPRVWPVKDGPRYQSYLERLAALAERLLRDNYDLVFFGSDGPDNTSIEDLMHELGRRVPSELMSRVAFPRAMTHQEMFRALQGAVAVVASRLHGVLLSHLVGLPVLALSYERKVATLMKTIEQEQYCLSIDDFAPDAAYARFTEIVATRQSLTAEIDRYTTEFARRVNDQYDRVFGTGGERA